MYRAVGNRIAVDFKKLRLPITEIEAIEILTEMGYKMIEVDIVKEAQAQVGKPYRRGALASEAPNIFDCSALAKWAYGQKGIWLPRYSIDQRSMRRSVTKIFPGDLIFCASYCNYYWSDPNDGVGHVGIATGEETVVHAANTKRGVVEDSVKKFIGDPKDFRGIRRYIPTRRKIYTFLIPPHRPTETSLELRWKILQRI